MSTDTERILRALRAISIQIMEVEKRLETLEIRTQDKDHTMLDLYLDSDTTTDSSDTDTDGYESAPATFSYTERCV